MAVVLSGAGADGSNEVRAVQESGGVVFAQDPAEAEFSAMPQNAIATGVVSFIAPISGLAERIAEVAKSKEAVRSLDEDGAANDLRRIVGFLHARTGHDFSSYKRATVMRRVLRRMQVCRITSPADYAEFVRTTPEEAHELFDDLLISVTQFFRDETAFEPLAAKVIGPLLEEAGEDGVRAWSVGCATGEEAYSLAILFLEEAERRKVKTPIQIFASDLDEGALGTAREGRYPRSIKADVSEERLERFFIDEGTHYRVRKELRDVVLFASHSVLKDPPFMRLDLIACRNLMIYMERSLQEQLLSLFHYGPELQRRPFPRIGGISGWQRVLLGHRPGDEDLPGSSQDASAGRTGARAPATRRCAGASTRPASPPIGAACRGTRADRAAQHSCRCEPADRAPLAQGRAIHPAFGRNLLRQARRGGSTRAAS